jgi:sugar phosphate isomerase/epimerase
VRLAISNIAWKSEDDVAVAAMMRATGVTGVEIAPSAVWADPLRATSADLNAYRKLWSAQGIEIVALQALLFGHPELTLFGAPAPRVKMLEHLTGMMDIARALGAGPLVFGSPRNRSIGVESAVSRDRARDIAIDFFREAGARAAQRGVSLCVEPNPPAYDCDFINTVGEALALVRDVDSPGFGLHLDAGAIALNAEPVAATVASAAGAIRHVHASEPFLAPLGSGETDHEAFSAALRAIAYDGWVSLEMRAPPDGLDGVQRALVLLNGRYGA